MIARIIELARRLTMLERFIVLWLLAAPLVLGVLVAFEVLLDASLAAVLILVAYYAIGMGCLALAVAIRVKRRRLEAAAVSGADIPLPRELASAGVLADDPPSWAAVDSDRLEQLRVTRRSATVSRRALLFFGMRSKSKWVREPISYLVTRGKFDFETLRRLLDPEDLGGERADILLTDIDLNLVLSLSRLVASQDLEPRDAAFSRHVHEFVARKLLQGDGRVSRGNKLHLAERLIMAGQLESVFPLIANMSSNNFTEVLLKADVLNPYHPNKLQDFEDLWLTAFNTIYHQYGLEPVNLGAEGPTPYDRLSAETGDVVTDGPLISVIMSCYQPDHALWTAVRSMIAQTWQNWELIVADDASGEQFSRVLDEIEAADSRIRVLRFDENRGTYVRRNDALKVARGEFVTMHDSDDWAHPRRLELQARHLLENKSAVANLSYSLRVSENLMFVQPRGATMRLTETSLLFRRKKVVERIGYFDSVRKAADSEYRLRMESAFKREVPIVDSLSPLALIRYTATSLSGSDLGDGWMHPSRVAYRSAQELWRNDITAGKASPYLEYPLEERPFPAHDRIVGREPSHLELDVLMVLDARHDAHPGGHLNTVVSELRALAAQGLTVGLLQMHSLLEGRTPAVMAPEAQRLINDGQIRHVLLGDDAHATTVVVRNATVLQGAPSVPSSIVADRVVIFEDKASGIDVRSRTFARADADASALHLFGVTAEWKIWESAVDYRFLDRSAKAEHVGAEKVVG